MCRKSFLAPALFFFCFSVFPQVSPPTSASGSTLPDVPPSTRLRNIAASLEELERSETVSLESLTKLKEDLATLEDLLMNSEAMLTELRTQTDSALERYERLWRRYEKQRKSLSAWKIGCLGSSGLTAVLLALLILL